MPIKKIFVCEFITGGGLCAESLPAGLEKEGALMRDALLYDLSELPYEISTTIDVRLNAPILCGSCLPVQKKDDIWQVWEKQIEKVDAVWLIAPETGGVLKRLTQLVISQGKLVLGCNAEAIEITSEKMATYLALEAVGLATIPTYTIDNWAKSHGVWLAKPNDGVGCSDTACFNNPDDLQDWMEQNQKQYTHVIQAYQSGTPASISCVMKNGKAHLLSCNTQEIEINHQMLNYTGGVINGMCDYWQQFESLANQVATMLPDLAGYVGIDVIVDNGEIVIVEINPRLTTSYVGMRGAIGTNPAALIINTLNKPDFIWPTLERNMVSVHV